MWWWWGAVAWSGDAPTVTGAMGKGLTVTSADGNFSMNVRGRMQLRDTVFVPPAEADGSRALTNQTQIYTTRMWLQGHTLSEDVKYTLQLGLSHRDYRDGAVSPIFDAMLDLTPSRDASIRVGQMFVPFDRLRTIREFALQLPDRPRVVSELSLDRDVGAYVYSDHLGGDHSPVAYRLGVFGGGGPNNTAPHALGGLVVGRLELRPLGDLDDDSEGDQARREKPGLAFGLAGAYNANSPRARSTTSTVYTAGTADYLHAAGDAVFKWRGFALIGEALLRRAAADRLRGTDDDGNPVVEYTRSAWGLVAQPSYAFTEHLELAARYGRLTALPKTDPTLEDDVAARQNELAGGLNVYLNGHRFKVQTGVTTFFGADVGAAEHAANVLVDVMF